MKNDSQIIASLFSELRQFNRETALLLSTAEKIFLRLGWSPQPGQGNICVHSGSQSLAIPDLWLPYRFFRTYVNSTHPHLLAFLAVIVDLPEEHEPNDATVLMTAAGLNFGSPKMCEIGISTTEISLYHWHTFRGNREDNRQPQWQHRPFQWNDSRLPKKWDSITAKIESAVTLGLPIHEITTAAQLEERIINPLLTAIQNGP